MTFPGWEKRLLLAMGIAVTTSRVRFLTAWAACEGGTARYNPLNTTMPVPGAQDYNTAHVKHYPDELAGLAATLLTIRLPYYRGLRRALERDDLDSLGIVRAGAAGLTTWGTGTKCLAAKLR